MTSPAFAESAPKKPSTSLSDVDEKVARVAAHKDEWVRVPIGKRIAYLEGILHAIPGVAEKWVEGGCKLKGIDPRSALAGEEWLAGPMATARNARLLIEALRAKGAPKLPAVTTRPDGQKVVTVFPTDVKDRAMFGGMVAEVWLEPGKDATQGRIYREAGHGDRKGKLALVLGAGNVSSIPPMDALHKLFVEDEVVVLKMNPVNDHVGARLEAIFKQLIDDGFMAVVYGGADVGAHLATHPKVDTLHVTGSDRTYDAIVWGPDREEQKRRKAAHDPINKRPFTAELGCVTPVLVVPGAWTDAEIDYQAKHVAGMVAQNASFNCNAAKVVVTAKDWDRRDVFLSRVRDQLSKAAPRKAYYPGAESRWRAFLDHYPQAEAVGAKGEGVVPWTVIPNVEGKAGEYALTNEAFCGVLAEVAIPGSGDDPAGFMRTATRFANDDCWGTLSCCVLVDPRTARAHADALDTMIANLRYGGVGVNVWPGILYALCSTTWGAFPGHPPEDIQSGAGVVHNTFLLDHPQKSVVKGPFVNKPKPAYFADHKTLDKVGRMLLDFEVAPSWGRLMKVAFHALRG